VGARPTRSMGRVLSSLHSRPRSMRLRALARWTPLRSLRCGLGSARCALDSAAGSGAAQIEFFYSTLFWTPFSGERPAYLRQKCLQNGLSLHRNRVNPRLRTRVAIVSMSASPSRRDAASCCCAARPLCTSSQLEHARVLLAVDLVLPLGLGRLVLFCRLACLGAVLGAKRARLRLRGRGGTEG